MSRSRCALLVLPYMAYWGGNWTGSWVKYLLVAASVALLIFRPRVEVPALAARLVLPVAASSYHIYLFHRLLPELLLPQPDVQLWQPLAAAIAVVGGILVGLGVYAVQRRLIGYLAERCMAGQAVLAPAEPSHPNRMREKAKLMNGDGSCCAVQPEAMNL